MSNFVESPYITNVKTIILQMKHIINSPSLILSDLETLKSLHSSIDELTNEYVKSGINNLNNSFKNQNPKKYENQNLKYKFHDITLYDSSIYDNLYSIIKNINTTDKNINDTKLSTNVGAHLSKNKLDLIKEYSEIKNEINTSLDNYINNISSFEKDVLLNYNDILRQYH